MDGHILMLDVEQSVGTRGENPFRYFQKGKAGLEKPQTQSFDIMITDVVVV